MADPLTTSVLSSAVSTFVGKLYDSGEKWVKSYLENHQNKAQGKGLENANDFIKRLGERVTELERNQEVSPEFLETAQEHPDFSVVLQKALLSATQTDNQNTHDLLSRLVAERLQASPESLVAVTSKMACDAISSITPNQLVILDVLVNILSIGPVEPLPAHQQSTWMQMRMSAIHQINIGPRDYSHLESLSCIKFTSFVTRNISEVLQRKLGERFDSDQFLSTPVGQKLNHVWKEDQLEKCDLTTTGELLGVMVSDQRLGDRTRLGGWT